MYRKDFLDRNFEEFGKVIAKLRDLILKKDSEQFLVELQEAFEKFTSVKIQEIQNLTEEEFNSNIAKNQGLLPDEKKRIADLLFEKMHLRMEVTGEGADQDLKQKCKTLYREVLENGTQNEFNLDVHYKIKYLALL